MQLPSKSNYNLAFLMFVIIAGLLFSCKKNDHWPPRATEESADVVYDWYKFIAKIQRPANPQPIVILNNRNFGYIGVGLYEAVSPGIKGSVSLSSRLYQMPKMPTPDAHKHYLWRAVANAALASMFKQFLTGLTDANKVSIDSLEEANNKHFRLSTTEDILSRSQAFGRAVANAIYNWSTTDNFNLSDQGYVPPVFPGAWVRTPPAFANPVGPFLKDSRPFLHYSLTSVAPAPPVPYSADPKSDFYKAAKEVYDIGKNLTDEQKAMVDWYNDSGGAGVGLPAPYHLLSVVTWILEKQNAKLGKAAEMYAKTGIAQKDGPIVTFRAKYKYNLIRPVSYVQQYIDPGWLPYVNNPPYPEYTSGLAGLWTPFLQVLIREFGDIPVTDNAYDWRGLAPRHFASLSKFAEEAAISRLYGGLHYRFTQTATLADGKALGDKIAAIHLINDKGY